MCSHCSASLISPSRPSSCAPGVDPHDRVELVGQHQGQQQRQLEAAGAERHHVGQRQADRQLDDHGGARDPEGVQGDLAVDRVGDDLAVVVERPAGAEVVQRLVVEADLQHDHHRHQEEQDQQAGRAPQVGERPQRAAQDPAFSADAGRCGAATTLTQPTAAHRHESAGVAAVGPRSCDPPGDEHQHHLDERDHGRDRVHDRQVLAVAQRGERPDRERVVGPADEVADLEVVERPHVGEDRRRHQRGRQVRQHHPAQHLGLGGAEVDRRLLLRAVEPGQPGRDDRGDQRERADDVHDADRPQAEVGLPDQRQVVVEEQQRADPDDQPRHDQRRPDDGRDAAPHQEAHPGQGEGRQGAQHQADRA